MFDALRKKLASFVGIKAKPTKKSKKEAKPKKEKKVKEPKKSKKESKKKEIQVTEQIEEIEVPTPSEPESFEVEIPKEEVKYDIKESEKPAVEIEEPRIEEKSEAQDIIEEAQEEEEKPKESFMSKFFKKLSSARLSEDQFEELFSELEITLLENNVALEVVDKIKLSLKEDLVGMQIKKNEAESQILESLKNAISKVIIEPPSLIDMIKKKQGVYTIIFFGINGSGKTTSIAKLAYKLKEAGISCVLGAGDTFRAASIEQLEKHGENLGIKVIKNNYGTDPAAVAFDTKKYAESNGIKVALIDTAGRMYTKENLLKEMEKIIRVSKPDLKVFVGESITGNDAVSQCKTFNEVVGIDGIILSKADIDDKAGTVLSVSQVTNKPIFYLGTGQNYKDLTPFTKKEVLKNLGLD